MHTSAHLHIPADENFLTFLGLSPGWSFPVAQRVIWSYTKQEQRLHHPGGRAKPAVLPHVGRPAARTTDSDPERTGHNGFFGPQSQAASGVAPCGL